MFLPITLTIAGACRAAEHLARASRQPPAAPPQGVDWRRRRRAGSDPHARAPNFAENTPIFLILLGRPWNCAVGANLWLWGMRSCSPVTPCPPVRDGAPRAQFPADRRSLLTWLALLALGAWAIALTYMRSAEPAIPPAGLGDQADRPAAETLS
jgi:hypothetical protein